MRSVSIIICCYNSASRIQETLKHIALQKIPENIECEVVVVNNASSDNTKQIAELSWAEFKNKQIDFIIVDQPIPGLANARIKGMETASGNIFLFCDDDNYLFKDYIEKGIAIFAQDNSIAIIGGHPLPLLEFYPGQWIEQVYSAMAIGPRAEVSCYIDWVYGAGMFVKKELFLELKKRNISFYLTGREKSKQTSGEDAELCIFARLLNYKVYYADELNLKHYMQKHRLNKMFFIKGNLFNIKPSIYLTIFSNMVKYNKSKILLTYFTWVAQFLYAFPRILIGKYKFHNFMMSFHLIQKILWLPFSFNAIHSMEVQIKKSITDARK